MRKKKNIKKKIKRKFNVEKAVAIVSVLVMVFYLFAHTIMKSAIAHYNIETQVLNYQINQLRSETASLDKERQQLVDPTKVAELAMMAGLEMKPDRRYTLMVE